jgi:UDPglucose 6-dehydrogenase
VIAFVGLSHLGLVHAIATAAKGFNVTGFDPNPTLVENLRCGDLPVFEPGLKELLCQHTDQIQFTSDPKNLSSCELVFLSLDVPTNDQNESNLEPLRNLITWAWNHFSPSATCVVLSQVPPGFTRSLWINKPVKHLFAQVETLVFGNAVHRALEPERFIVGCADPQEVFPSLYSEWQSAFNCPVLPMRFESAELAKISINCFLVSSVTTTNTLAEICEHTGADWSEIAPALRLDRRIGPYAYLTPGLGIAGGNLERDLVTVCQLASRYGSHAEIVTAWQNNSRYRADWALRQLHRVVLPRCSHPRIAVWGLTYKVDTHSMKNSAAVALIAALAPFQITAFDPMVASIPVHLANLELAPNALAACHEADVLIVMTPWKHFSQVNPAEIQAEMRGRFIIDPYGIISAPGFTHLQLGL